MEDPYSRVDYRRMVAWPERIRREAPFLRKILERSPTPSVIDLGCGTGEHCRFLAEEGFNVVGLDRSESMLDKAGDEALPENLNFVLGEIQEVDQKLQKRFGAAISLGNTLVHLKSESELETGFNNLGQIIEEKGLFLFQILNYERIFEKKIRHLPLNFRPGEGDEEIIFLRLMELLEEGKVLFCPPPSGTTLRAILRSSWFAHAGWNYAAGDWTISSPAYPRPAFRSRKPMEIWPVAPSSPWNRMTWSFWLSFTTKPPFSRS